MELFSIRIQRTFQLVSTVSILIVQNNMLKFTLWVIRFFFMVIIGNKSNLEWV